MLENLVLGAFRLLGGGPIFIVSPPLGGGDIDLNAIVLKQLIREQTKFPGVSRCQSCGP